MRLADGRTPLAVTVSACGPGGALALSESRGLTPEGFTHLAPLPPGPGRRPAVPAPEPGGAPRSAWPLAAGVGYVDGLPAGVWTVAAAGPRGEAWRATVQLAPGAESELVLE